MLHPAIIHANAGPCLPDKRLMRVSGNACIRRATAGQPKRMLVAQPDSGNFQVPLLLPGVGRSMGQSAADRRHAAFR